MACDSDLDVDDLAALFEDEDNEESKENITNDDNNENSAMSVDRRNCVKENHKDDHRKDKSGKRKNVENKEKQAIDDEISKVKQQLEMLQHQLELKQKEAERLGLNSRPINTTENRNAGTKSKIENSAAQNLNPLQATRSDKEDLLVPVKNKSRVAHVAKHDPMMERNAVDNVNSKKRKFNEDSKPRTASSKDLDNRPFSVEEYSGIRIINPLVSSKLMESRMEGRKFIRMHSIAKHIINNEIKGDWVTVGVLVKKLPPKTAANGKTFSIWKLSDLVIGCENDTSSLFLFGDVYKEHWKTTEGSVIGLLNASILPQRDSDQIGSVAITVDNPKKMMMMGISKDLGHCKGSTKGGKLCSLIVNKSRGNFCEYHVSREHKKMTSHRMELQSGGAPDPRKGGLMKKLKKEVESGNYCYAGETLTWKDNPEGPRKVKEEKLTLQAIAGLGADEFVKKTIDDVTHSANSTNNLQSKEEKLAASEEFKSRLQIPTAGSRNLMHLLKREEKTEKEKLAALKSEQKSAKDLLIQEKKQGKSALKQVDINLTSSKLKQLKPPSKSIRHFASDFKPKLGRGFDPEDDIEFADFGDVVSDGLGCKIGYDDDGFKDCRVSMNTSCGTNGIKLSTKKVADKVDIAKKKAIAIVRSKRIKLDKNETTSKNKSPEALQKINERVLKDISDNDSENKEPLKKKRKGILDDVFGSLDLNSEEGKRILKTKSLHVGQVRQAEAEREAAYFNVLEKKEMYEEKMQNIMELKVKVVCCKICKYMHEFASSYCKEQGHNTIRVEAIKRFFACKNCKHRITAFKKLPTHPCQ